MWWTVFLFVVTLSILVAVHEFGHFIVARFFGVKVLVFSIGFGKALFSHQGKRTQFRIGCIPLGGYVKMQDSRFETVPHSELNRAFDQQSFYKRALILGAGPFFNVLFAVILYWAISLNGLSALKPVIAKIEPNSIAALSGLQADQQIIAINHQTVNQWSQINTMMMQALRAHQALIIEVKAENTPQPQEIIINPAIEPFDAHSSALKQLGIIPESRMIYPVIEQVIPNSAAAQAGLEVGDRLLRYKTTENQPFIALSDKMTTEQWNEWVDVIRVSPRLFVEIQRDNQIFIKAIDLKPEHKKDEIIYSLGIFPTDNTILLNYGILSGLKNAIEICAHTIGQISTSFYQLLTGKVGLDQLSGPIGVAQSAAKASEYGLSAFLSFCAFISLSLGFVNLIPIPALDGGQLLLLCIEKLKGSALSKRAQLRFFQVGFLILMALMAVVFFNDFNRL